MISVVTAYYNRKKLFYNTLLRLQNSSNIDFEVVVVDDGSNEENRLEDLEAIFDFLKVIRLEPKNKWYINSCIPFNIGFKAAKGNIIIIQNPECIHYGDILKYVKENLKQNEYLSFGVYSLDKRTTEAINDTNAGFLESLKIPFFEKSILQDGESGWYNHSTHRPKGFHWCTAIFKNDLDSLGGFDERYALGVAFDDNELLARIQKKGMDYKIIDEPFVLHQNHFNVDIHTNKSINPFYTRKDAKLLWDKNEYIFNKLTLQGKGWCVKKHSIFKIRLHDFLITQRMQFKKLYEFFSWRIINKLNRIYKTLTNK